MLLEFQQFQKEHLYYYRQYSLLSAATDAIRDLQVSIYRELEQVWVESLTNLRQAGLVAKELANTQSRLLISAILFISARWHERDRLDQALGIPTPGFRDVVWALFMPMLTARGRKISREKIAETISGAD